MLVYSLCNFACAKLQIFYYKEVIFKILLQTFYYKEEVMPRMASFGLTFTF